MKFNYLFSDSVHAYYDFYYGEFRIEFKVQKKDYRILVKVTDDLAKANLFRDAIEMLAIKEIVDFSEITDLSQLPEWIYVDEDTYWELLQFTELDIKGYKYFR